MGTIGNVKDPHQENYKVYYWLMDRKKKKQKQPTFFLHGRFHIIKMSKPHKSIF